MNSTICMYMYSVQSWEKNLVIKLMEWQNRHVTSPEPRCTVHPLQLFVVACRLFVAVSSALNPPMSEQAADVSGFSCDIYSAVPRDLFLPALFKCSHRSHFRDDYIDYRKSSQYITGGFGCLYLICTAIQQLKDEFSGFFVKLMNIFIVYFAVLRGN